VSRGDSRSPDSHQSYSSVSERIGWLAMSHFKATDQLVLIQIARFANHRTGVRACPRLELLVQRSGKPYRTLTRATERLVRDGWLIVVNREHRRPTTYNINLDKIEAAERADKQALDDFRAMHQKPVNGAKVETPLSPTIETQEAENPNTFRGSNLTFKSVLTDKIDLQKGVLKVTGDTPSPVRTDPQLRTDPQELRAVAREPQNAENDVGTTKGESPSPPRRQLVGHLHIGLTRLREPRRRHA